MKKILSLMLVFVLLVGIIKKPLKISNTTRYRIGNMMMVKSSCN